MPRLPLALPLALAALAPGMSRADGPPLAAYFEAEVGRIAARPLLGIEDAEAWKARRPELQARLRSMLGLDPMPERTDLKVEVRGVVERPEFVVERIHYQSSPGLYVTANLYRPKEAEGPLPAVLYVCGHANVVRDGVIYGCKAHYQHHAAWYAANGYVCLVVDTLQLGEVPGLHHGTYREGRWWWQSRGYTPAGVEVWNGIRAIDYLQSRPEVDPDRIGVTGRSGGGAISWYLGAVDDRLAAVIPVAGIAGLEDHLLRGGPTGAHPDGVIEGHCDCMYLVNADGWDFDTLAALVAPKPLLVENTDRDPIFPEAGVRRIVERLEEVYRWYDASDRLGLVIGEGGHVDTEEIRHPSFAFMNTWLKGEPTAPADIEEPDRKVPIEDLKVLGLDEPIPADALNARIDEVFVPVAEPVSVPRDEAEWKALRDRWMEQVRSEVFGGWPDRSGPFPSTIEFVTHYRKDGMDFARISFRTQAQHGLTLDVWVLAESLDRTPERVDLLVSSGPLAWSEFESSPGSVFGDATPEKVKEWLDHYRSVVGEEDPSIPIAIICPRGFGPTAWPQEKETHLRRRFALIGQTLDGMRVWDIRRAIDSMKGVPELHLAPVHLFASGAEAPLALWAAVFEPGVEHVRLRDLPASYQDGPIFLNLERVMEPARALGLLYPRAVTIDAGTDPAAYRWASELAGVLGSEGPWPEVVD